MNDWVLLGIITIIAVYKLLDRWLDSREVPMRESDTYSMTERAADEGDYEDRVRIGFQRGSQ